MKIGFIIGNLDYSGAEKIARHLITALIAKGHELGVILLSRKEPYNDLQGVSQYPIFVTGNRFVRVLTRQSKIKKIVKDAGFDVVLSFGVKFNLDAMEALADTGIPTILCERNDPVNDPRSLLLRLRRWLCYPKAAGFVFQTERIGDFFGKKIKSRSVIIPNFIEKQYPYLYDGKKDNNIVITARLDDNQKNISMLLRAFKRFLSNHPDYHLYIVGDGPDRNKFESFVEASSLGSNVTFTGKQNVLPYLEIAKFYVLSSNYEGMPNSLIEAMAVGLPCISTDCSGGGAEALITHMKNGLLTPVRDEDSLVNYMDLLASDDELCKTLSHNAYAINNTLEFSKIINMWVNYLESFAIS